ncbi:MAG: hypothetical protein ABIP75_10120 [Pyrinomonadaceae bacterium]
MEVITIDEIDGKLKLLSDEKLVAVYHFVSYLVGHELDGSDVSASELMKASESLIASNWDTPEEDQAWADL